MNEDAVQALKEAMEPPSWWPNRARLKPREVLGRLEELGYTVAPRSEARAGGSADTSSASHASPQEGDGRGLTDLMADLETNVAAVKESREAERRPSGEGRKTA